jgi:hypothetical protein
VSDTSLTYLQFLLDERRRTDGDRNLTKLLHSVVPASKARSKSLELLRLRTSWAVSSQSTSTEVRPLKRAAILALRTDSRNNGIRL